jgi:hypothetical protein
MEATDMETSPVTAGARGHQGFPLNGMGNREQGTENTHSPFPGDPGALVTWWLVVGGLFVGALCIYVATAARTITWAHGGADGAELSAAAAVLGIPHPPGYPLYTLLGHLFAQIPVGEVAFRVGLLSAVSAALGVALAGVVTHRLQPRTVAAVGAGGALATAPMYWSQATIPEVYALHAALVVASLAVLAAWHPGNDRLLVGLALLFGLGMAHHVTMVFLIAPSAIYVLASDPGVLRRRVLLAGVAAFGLGLLFYLYLPIRAAADPLMNWGNPDSWPRFLDHVFARSYQGYLGGRPVGDVLARVPVVARLLLEQFTWPGFVLALLGLAELARVRPGFGRMLIGYLVLTIAFTLMYNAKDGEVYLLPTALVLAPCLGLGAAHLAGSPGGRWLALAAVVAIPLWQLATNWAEMDLSADRTAITYARDTLSSAPRDGVVVLDQDEETFALWYAQAVEGLRPDVAVVDSRALGLGWYVEQLERRHPGATRRTLQ